MNTLSWGLIFWLIHSNPKAAKIIAGGISTIDRKACGKLSLESATGKIITTSHKSTKLFGHWNFFIETQIPIKNKIATGHQSSASPAKLCLQLKSPNKKNIWAVFTTFSET